MDAFVHNYIMRLGGNKIEQYVKVLRLVLFLSFHLKPTWYWKLKQGAGGLDTLHICYELVERPTLPVLFFPGWAV